VADRGLSSTLNTALSSQAANLALLVALDWPGGYVRVWTGVGSVSWNSYTWTGTGQLGSIDKIGDSLTSGDVGVQLTFNYLDDSLRNAILGTDPVGRAADIWLATIDPATKVVTADATLDLLFPGFIDEVGIEDAGSTGAITVRLASELARLRRPTAWQLTDAHQQKIFAGDKGCEFAPRMDEPILWGRKPVQVTTGIEYPTGPGWEPGMGWGANDPSQWWNP
jgi:hypothetical protein